MQNIQEIQELNQKQHLSGYELTYCTIHNLKNYNLTATAKLVLVLLTTHYNEQKNGAVVFPSIPYISETLGIGQTATKQAIKDLISNGLIIKAKRSKIKGNYNKYLLTLKVQNTACEQAENECLKQAESDRFHEHEPVNMNLSKETTNKGKNVVAFKKFSSKKCGSVNLDDVPNIIKNKKDIKNPCAYWASLSAEVKAEYLQKEQQEQEKWQKQAEKLKQEQERIKQKQQEQKELKEELSKPLNEQFSREQAIRFVTNLCRMKNSFVKKGLAGELVKIYNIQESELLK